MRYNSKPPRLDLGAASRCFTKLTAQYLHKSPVVRKPNQGPLHKVSGKGGLT